MSVIPYLNKMRKYCAYQERCESEVLDKMKNFPLRDQDRAFIIEKLYDENFMNEERYLRSFIKGKVNVKWGRKKILYALRSKKVNMNFAEELLSEIDEERYEETMIQLAHKKYASLKDTYSVYEKRQKTAVYLQSKGYESDMIFKILDKELEDE